MLSIEFLHVLTAKSYSRHQNRIKKLERGNFVSLSAGNPCSRSTVRFVVVILLGASRSNKVHPVITEKRCGLVPYSAQIEEKSNERHKIIKRPANLECNPHFFFFLNTPIHMDLIYLKSSLSVFLMFLYSLRLCTNLAGNLRHKK